MSAKISFEENLEKLREIVEKLESSELPLKDSFKKFQEGTDIIKKCCKELETAELEINKIIKKNGDIIEEPLEG